jgi:FkbM family methyltransferase
VNGNHAVGFQVYGKHLTLSFASEEDHIAAVIRQTGTFYEAEMLSDVRSRVFYGECALDVGAHVGNHALYFSHVLGLRTIAFEPNPVSFERLEANIEANGLAGRCEARNVAVGSLHGRARASQPSERNSGMATVEADAAGAVEVVTLDEEVEGEPRIDLIKIDVEGWELDVLRGAARTLARHRPLLYVEIMQAGFDEVQAHLRDAGYLCWKRFNATPTFLFLPGERLGRG